MTKKLQEYHFGINGENYEMLNTAKVIAEGDYSGQQLVDDVYEYTLTNQDVVVANQVVNNQWFNDLGTLPIKTQQDRLMEWFKLGIFEYMMNSGVTSVIREILTPKEYSDLLYIMRNGHDLESECMRLAYKLSAVYQDDLNMWYEDNYTKFNESLDGGIAEQDLSFKISKKEVTFYSDNEEIEKFKIAHISNMTDKGLFDLVYDFAQQYVPNLELIDVADFAVMLQSEVANVLREQIDESKYGLTEDVPQDENPQQFDILGDIVNGNNISAEKRFDSDQNMDTQQFDNDGDMKVSTGKGKISDNALDNKIYEVAGVPPEEVNDVVVKKIDLFDELTSLAIGDTQTARDEMATYEIYNPNISELVFYLIVDLPENQCIVNIMDQDGEVLTELTEQLVDYALATQLNPDGTYIGIFNATSDIEESMLNEDGGVYVAQENVEIGQAAGVPNFADNDRFSSTGAILHVDSEGDQVLNTSDPELAFDLEVITNDDGSVSVIGNIPATINALCGVQAEQVKADLIGDESDEYNNENNSTTL